MIFFKKTEDALSSVSSSAQSQQLSDLSKKIAQTELPEHARLQAANELEKLEKTDPLAAEYAIGLHYLEILLSLPWNFSTQDNLDFNRVQSLLSKHHFGLEHVKERVLEFLAAKTLRSQQKARILIVDDEEIARNNLRYFFAKDGYSVQTAANGREALHRFENGGCFDVVITDLKMDEMDGIKLLERVTKISPDTNVILLVMLRFPPPLMLYAKERRIISPNLLSSMSCRAWSGRFCRNSSGFTWAKALFSVSPVRPAQGRHPSAGQWQWPLAAYLSGHQWPVYAMKRKSVAIAGLMWGPCRAGSSAK